MTARLVDSLILVSAAQIRQPVETVGGSVDAFRPPCLRRASVHSRRCLVPLRAAPWWRRVRFHALGVVWPLL
jgi:hypothetical protein